MVVVIRHKELRIVPIHFGSACFFCVISCMKKKKKKKKNTLVCIDVCGVVVLGSCLVISKGRVDRLTITSGI